MCNGDAWGQRHPNTYFVLTVTFVEFLVLTSRGMGAPGRKAGTTTCRCHGQAGYSGEAYGIGIMGGTGVNHAWCSVDVHSIPWRWTIPDRVHSVETGPGVVLVDLDKVVQE